MILRNRFQLSLWPGLPASIVLLLATAAVLAQEPESAALPLEPCELRVPGTAIAAPAECGRLEVPENPNDPDGRRISLNVARVPAMGRTAKPDPLIFFAGGPGQAATEAWLLVAGALRKVNEERDIILVDQRGTGGSNPLKCPEVEIHDLLSNDWDRLEDLARNCLEGIEGDPRFYTTTIAMQDYDRVRQALGYEQVNLFGGSYGTRAAQVYLRLFPERVRAVVLDSVMPQDEAMGVDHAQNLDRSVSRVLENCSADPDCSAQFPDTPAKLRGLIQRLENEAVPTTFDHPLTGETLEFDFDRDALAGSLRFLMYSPESQALLPLLINEAAASNNFSRLASQMLIATAGLEEGIAVGMQNSVMCAEDYPLFPSDDSASGMLMGNQLIEALRVQCEIWPRGPVPEDFHAPVVSDKPTLLLSGELDPVTPPEYGEHTAQYFSNSLHLVGHGQGHILTTRGCMGDIVSAFIESANVEGLEMDCLNKLESTPFFVSLTGPNP